MEWQKLHSTAALTDSGISLPLSSHSQFLTLDSLVQCRAVPGAPALLAVDTLRLRRPGLAGLWPTLDTIHQDTLFLINTE